MCMVSQLVSFTLQAKFREEDVEMACRVDELTSSLDSLCQEFHIPVLTPPPETTFAYFTLADDSSPPTPPTPPTPLATSGEWGNDTGTASDSDDEGYRQFCASYSKSPVLQPGVDYRRTFPSIHLTSAPQLHEEGSHNERSKEKDRWSALSVPSDALMFTFPSKPVTSKEGTIPRSFSYQGKEYQHTSLTYQNGHYRPRPLSYQEMTYDENDFEESNYFSQDTWNELSCP